MLQKAREVVENENVLFWALATLIAIFIASYVYGALTLLSGFFGVFLALLLFLLLGGIFIWVLTETKRKMVRKISDTRRR